MLVPGCPCVAEPWVSCARTLACIAQLLGAMRQCLQHGPHGMHHSTVNACNRVMGSACSLWHVETAWEVRMGFVQLLRIICLLKAVTFASTKPSHALPDGQSTHHANKLLHACPLKVAPPQAHCCTLLPRLSPMAIHAFKLLHHRFIDCDPALPPSTYTGLDVDLIRAIASSRLDIWNELPDNANDTYG